MPPTSRSRRSRHRAVKSADTPASLHPHEREILLQAVAAGGSYRIEGLPMRDMARAAQVVFDLQRSGMAKSDIAFEKDKQPMIVTVTITDKGRKALDGHT
jgi:hypothetical protein